MPWWLLGGGGGLELRGDVNELNYEDRYTPLTHFLVAVAKRHTKREMIFNTKKMGKYNTSKYVCFFQYQKLGKPPRFTLLFGGTHINSSSIE